MGFWDWFAGRPSRFESYRDAVLPALRRAHPGLDFGPGEEPHEVVGRQDGKQVIVSLRSFFERVKTERDSMAQSQQRLLAFVERLLGGGPPFTREELLAGVKPLLLPKTCFEARATNLVRRAIRSESFERIYGFDAGSHVLWVTDQHLAELGITAGELDEAAAKNLAASSTEQHGRVEILGDESFFLGHVFRFEDGLASSRVFDRRFRAFLDEAFEGEGYRFAVPNRDVLLVIRASVIPDAALVRQWFDADEHPLSPDLHAPDSFLAAA